MRALRQCGPNVWHFPEWEVPAEVRGHWCIITAQAEIEASAHLQLDLLEADGEPAEGFACHLSHKARVTRSGICFVPADAARARLVLWGRPKQGGNAKLFFRRISRGQAATRLLLSHPSLVVGRATRWAHDLIRGEDLRKWLGGALRPALDAEAPSGSYAFWASLFDVWRPSDLPEHVPGPSLGVLVFHVGPDGAEAVAATIGSLAHQWGPSVPYAVVGGAGGADFASALADLPHGCDYIGILQAGEILPPHAVMLALVQIVALGLPVHAYADEDWQSTPNAPPSDPLFKPEPNRTLMLSGTISRGLWLVRRSALASFGAEAARDSGYWAEAFRLGLWLRLQEAGMARRHDTRRIPFVLTHRRLDAETAPPEVLARCVADHLSRTRMPMTVTPGRPLHVRAAWFRPDQRVSIIVPSTLRSLETEECIHEILRRTSRVDFELVVVVSHPGPLDANQRTTASRIEADPRARVMPLTSAEFNYSWVNNQAARVATGDYVLLLNDDVCPIEPDWLHAMLAHFADPQVGVVGAKLLYPDGTVQHGGVIMGLGRHCGHAHSFLRGDAPGYAGLAILAHELSAVTGACLLIRRGLLERLGGLDESYPTAFNDVDMCLRARESGYAVVFAPEATLWHRESYSFSGDHYGGKRAAFRKSDMARLRARWLAVIAEDPFHSPNLTLIPGREGCPAFPPRTQLPIEGGTGSC